MSSIKCTALCSSLIITGAMWIGTAVAAILPEQEQVVPNVTSCDDDKQLELTVGLSTEYEEPSPEVITAPRPGLAPVCVSFARGNTYQLLSWLENSNLQAVVLPKFAVEMLALSSPFTFSRNYVVLKQSPFQLLQTRERHLAFKSAGGVTTGERAFEALFDEIGGQKKTPRILVPDHLSMAVDHLLSLAVEHANERKLTGDDRDEFFSRLIDGIAFREPLQGESSQGSFDFEYAPAPVVEPEGSPYQVTDRDLLVLNRHILLSYPELQERVAMAEEASVPTSVDERFKWSTPGDGGGGNVLSHFFADNYALIHYGSASRRYFRFTIEELWGLLDQGATFEVGSNADRDMALVLTGGGVKAAYQTRLIEHFYESGLLYNSEGGEQRTAVPENARQVDYVIGTSGGAMLGIFVSALNGELVKRFTRTEDTSLTAALWGREGDRVPSWKIFPMWDLMRYASFVASFAVLLLIGGLVLHLAGKRYQLAAIVSKTSVSEAGVSEASVSSSLAAHPRWKRWIVGNGLWVLLLGIAPYAIVVLAKRKGLEHVPALAGLFYLFMVLVAADIDQRLSPTGAVFGRATIRRWFQAVAFLIAGIAVVWISYSYEWRDTGCDDWSHAIVYCMAGFALLSLALHRFYAQQNLVFVAESPWPFFVALATAICVVAASYALLLAGMLMGKVAILELTTSFWMWMLGGTAIFMLVLMALGGLRDKGSPRFPQIHRIVSFLFSRHPTRHWIVGRRRLTRFVLYGTAGWLWWNLMAAPGLYGNCDARDYFVKTYDSFVSQSELKADTLELTVPFVITATSLEKSQERYFLFPSKGNDERGGVRSDVWFNLVSDPRWFVVKDFNNGDLQSVAFASGSPFPVFSSHEVSIQSEKFNERLIDGGFAHNRPLDAARELGARRVLVLNSTPLPEQTSMDGCAFGELACNLPKLGPYLWERSQTEDHLSSMTMFVASIYPTRLPNDRDWPVLTDFYGDVVDTMLLAADRDALRRIGVVDSWGIPKLGDATLMMIDMSSVNRQLNAVQ